MSGGDRRILPSTVLKAFLCWDSLLHCNELVGFLLGTKMLNIKLEIIFPRVLVGIPNKNLC